VINGQRIIDSAIIEAERLLKTIKREKSGQVRSAEEKQIIKATAHAWFNSHRTTIAELLGNDQIKPIDDLYRQLLAAAARSTVRGKYVSTIKEITRKLGTTQADHVIVLANATTPAQSTTSDRPPIFAPLIADAKMQAILSKRWQECGICVASNAPLAATVMMGGLLEGLLLAKINQLPNKAPVFSAAAAPVDPKTGKTLQLKEWGLKNYIAVAYELGWITKTTKDIGEVVRDYRNFIHPQKELSHGIILEAGDARMLWEVAKSITLQLLKPP
jgi:hypothetical protein